MTPRERGQDVLRDTEPKPPREWLMADGVGGFSYGGSTSVPERRAHAWLHALDAQGVLTTVLLGLEERARTEEGLFHLAEWPGREAGESLATIESFHADPWPTWRIRAGGLLLERSIIAIHDHHAIAVTYRHVEGPHARLRLSPLVVARDPHGVQRENPGIGVLAQGIPGRVRVETRAGGPTLTLWHQGSFLPNRLWRRAIDHALEARRSREDAVVPGHLDGDLRPGGGFHVVISTEETLFRALATEGRLGAPPPSTLAACVAALLLGEQGRRGVSRSAAQRGADFTARQAAAAHGDATLARRPSPLIEPSDAWTTTLAWAVQQGLARRGDRLTLTDPLPPASEDGARSLGALPGLISIRAFEPVRDVLQGVIAYLDDGVAPSGFDGKGSPRHDSAEPSLWAIHAAELEARRSEESDWIRDLYPALESVLHYYRGGTRAGIRVDGDGLLQVGNEGVKPAALNALWYHALVAMAQLARQLGRKENAAFYLAWARQHGQSFNERFWNEPEGALFTAITKDGPVPGIEPDHLLALSLTPPLLAPERAGRLLERIERDLFTPLGLRPEPGATRVAPAWLGAFHATYLRVHERSGEAQSTVRGWIETLSTRLETVAPDHVPAAFEWPAARRSAPRAAALPIEEALPIGASPLAAAELLRVWIEEVAHTPEPAGVA
jgi:hypothetical protein